MDGLGNRNTGRMLQLKMRHRALLNEPRQLSDCADEKESIVTLALSVPKIRGIA
jgi:hypothetical protein